MLHITLTKNGDFAIRVRNYLLWRIWGILWSLDPPFCWLTRIFSLSITFDRISTKRDLSMKLFEFYKRIQIPCISYHISQRITGFSRPPFQADEHALNFTRADTMPWNWVGDLFGFRQDCLSTALLLLRACKGHYRTCLEWVERKNLKPVKLLAQARHPDRQTNDLLITLGWRGDETRWCVFLKFADGPYRVCFILNSLRTHCPDLTKSEKPCPRHGIYVLTFAML